MDRCAERRQGAAEPGGARRGTGPAGAAGGDVVRGDPSVDDVPVEVLEERVHVRSPIGLVVEEVRVLVHVQRDERGRVPDGEGVLRVADVVEQPRLVAVEGRPRPAPRGHRGRLQIGSPRVDGAEVPLGERLERAVGIAPLATEVREVELVVLDPANREGEVDLERPDLRVDLVRLAEVDAREQAENLVPLRDVPLVETVVGLDGRAGNARKLEQPGVERAGGDLLERRHRGSSCGRTGA